MGKAMRTLVMMEALPEADEMLSILKELPTADQLFVYGVIVGTQGHLRKETCPPFAMAAVQQSGAAIRPRA